MTKNLFHDNSKCMIVIVLSFIIYHLSFSPVSAQTFTQRVQQPAQTGKGSVTIHQSQAIDQLVNNAALGNKVAAKPASSTSTTSKTSSTSTTSTPSTAKPVSPSATTDTVGINKPVRGYKLRVIVYRPLPAAIRVLTARRQSERATASAHSSPTWPSMYISIRRAGYVV